MSVSTRLTLRPATADDLPAIAGLRESVGWTVNAWALRAVVGRPHARCVVVDTGGELAAVGSGIAYGRLGFVGNMVVVPEHRRRGLGSAILEDVTSWLTDAGCTRLELNATEDGMPLYERHGFTSRGWSQVARVAPGTPLGPDPATTVRPASGADAEAFAAYDRPRFGGDRAPLLAELLADPAARALAAADGDDGLRGFAFVRTDEVRVGPMVADTPGVAASLLRAAFGVLPGVDELRINLPPDNRVGAAWLRELGLELQPWDGRMARGADIPRDDDAIYQMTVGALG